MRPPRVTRILLAHALALAALQLGCDEKKGSQAAASLEAGTDKYVAADPKLAKALQSAASDSDADTNGPPPDGVFGPGLADQRHPRATATKVDLASAGSEPRISLAAAQGTAADEAKARGYGPAVLEFGTVMGGTAMGRVAYPTLDLALVLGPPKKGDEAAGNWLVADVRKATAAKEQYGQLPPNFDRDAATIAGTELRLQLMSDGRADGVQVQLGKTALPDFDAIVQIAAQDLLLFTVPVPPSPVGVGGQWIAESRMQWFGADVLVYRAYRVKSIDGDRVDLSLVAQAYATSGDTQPHGVPKGATIQQFQAQAQGEYELVRGELLPRKATLEQRMTALLQAPTEGASPSLPSPSQPGQQSGVILSKFQGEAMLLRGDDLRAASAR
jgi:hypothetical protein